VVVGPAGEEIHTDKYGRVRVQFHWDREGKKDDKSSVWVRTMMPWTGKNWGMIAIPRIGQEVVVQFEEGNPDRPMVVGMLYNADTMPPYALPDNMTQSGIKTNSTKGGGGFNELMMEDKKGSELVRFQAEKDYTQIVKNNARITVGVEKKDAGNMDLTVHANLTETVKTGHHSFTVASGQQTIKIKKDKTETIEGGSTLTVTDDVKSTVKMGNVSETVEMGNVTQDIKMGNQTTTVDLGNVKVDVKLGKIEMEAMQSIKLTVGGNSVEITQAGVTVKGIMVKIEATAMLEAKAPMTQIKGDALLTLKGGITLIN
jgi:type VI secretion system secreted protein VgrG